MVASAGEQEELDLPRWAQLSEVQQVVMREADDGEGFSDILSAVTGSSDETGDDEWASQKSVSSRAEPEEQHRTGTTA